MWFVIAESINTSIENNYESVAGKWLSNKEFGLVNMITTAALWSIWKLRNYFVLQHTSWVGCP